MVTITTNTLRRTVFKTVYDVLNTASDLTGATIVSWYTMPEDLSKVVFPVISVTRPTKDTEEFVNIKESNNYQRVSVIIDIFAKSNDSCQMYADYVDKAIQSGKSSMRNDGMKHIKLEDAPPNEPIPINTKNHVHIHSMILTCDRYR